MENNLVNVNINGVAYEVAAGTNVLEACRSVGVEVPYFCYHPSLKVAGSCRMCLVITGMPARDRATGELVKNPDGSPVIAYAPKPAISCGTNVAEGMHIITDSPEVKKCREGVLEFLLVNHPLDCPICDKAGECKLQEYAHSFGAAQSRYTEAKNVKPKKVEVGGKIILDAERCILCSRCIRFCKEIIGKDIFGFIKRGSRTEIAAYLPEDSSENYILNVVDGCPVGALTEKAFRFQMRTWFLKVANGICGESSAGVNTRVWSREGKIYRITPRLNKNVNDSWMSDSGRYEYKNASPRIETACIDASQSEISYAIDRCAEILKMGELAVVANGSQTVEEMFILKKVADELNAEVHMASHLDEDDGFLLSADRKPNTRGAFATKLVSEYPKQNLSELAEKVSSGKIKTLLVFGEDLSKLGFDVSLLKKVNLIYCGDTENETSKSAKISIPCRSNFEKDGLWINRQFRLQAFDKALEPSFDAVSYLEFTAKVYRDIKGLSFEIPSVREVRKLIEAEIPMLANCSKVGSSGLPLDGSSFDSVDFPEKQAFKFEK